MHQQTTTEPLAEVIARLESLLAASGDDVGFWQLDNARHTRGRYTAEAYFPAGWFHPDATRLPSASRLRVHGDDLATTVTKLADQLAATVRGAA